MRTNLTSASQEESDSRGSGIWALPILGGDDDLEVPNSEDLVIELQGYHQKRADSARYNRTFTFLATIFAGVMTIFVGGGALGLVAQAADQRAEPINKTVLEESIAKSVDDFEITDDLASDDFAAQIFESIINRDALRETIAESIDGLEIPEEIDSDALAAQLTASIVNSNSIAEQSPENSVDSKALETVLRESVDNIETPEEIDSDALVNQLTVSIINSGAIAEQLPENIVNSDALVNQLTENIVIRNALVEQLTANIFENADFGPKFEGSFFIVIYVISGITMLILAVCGVFMIRFWRLRRRAERAASLHLKHLIGLGPEQFIPKMESEEA